MKQEYTFFNEKLYELNYEKEEKGLPILRLEYSKKIQIQTIISDIIFKLHIDTNDTNNTITVYDLDESKIYEIKNVKLYKKEIEEIKNNYKMLDSSNYSPSFLHEKYVEVSEMHSILSALFKVIVLAKLT